MQDDKSIKRDSQLLFELLRQKRNEIAKESNVKPFMILHNKVLEEIAKKKPTTLEELTKIKGMGQKRIARFGEFILETVNSPSGNEIPEASEEKIFSVSEYLDYLNEILIPARAIIHGEVGRVDNRERYTFFTLKDEEAVINCFAWQSRLESFGVELKEGLELKVEGFPQVFKRRGNLNFEVEHVGLVGEGALKQAFELLKKKLAIAGFFALERKKILPKYIERIGLVTSDFGDAKNDFLTHLGKFGFKIYFYDVRVEGLYTIDDIVKAIRWFNENLLDIEVLVLTRGGGSLESLQAFNSEAVAKAIFGSKIPIVTGIGHENDETIADLVTDFYASTPTDAARVLSDPWRNADPLISNYVRNIISIFSRFCYTKAEELTNFKNSYVSNFSKFLIEKRGRINDFSNKLTLSFRSYFEKFRIIERDLNNNLELLREELKTRYLKIRNFADIFKQEVNRWLKFLNKKIIIEEQKLKLSDPTSRLRQGYSIVFNLTGQVVKSTRIIKVGENLNLKFYQGSATSRVEKISS